jgi:hypothetical protein
MSCRCRAGSTAIAVAKSGAEGGGPEQCLRNHLRGGKQGSSDRQKRAVGTPLSSLGPALVANSLCRWQEKRTMRESEVQIGNPGLNKIDVFPVPEIGLFQRGVGVRMGSIFRGPE